MVGRHSLKHMRVCVRGQGASALADALRAESAVTDLNLFMNGIDMLGARFTPG